jgi:Ca2+-binding EF-hand superfamily protein
MTLSTVQISKLWEAFSVFDTEGNGSISLAELAQVTQSLGQSLHPAQLREMLREVDTDNSGSIDFAEFQALMISQVGDRRSR